MQPSFPLYCDFWVIFVVFWLFFLNFHRHTKVAFLQIILENSASFDRDKIRKFAKNLHRWKKCKITTNSPFIAQNDTKLLFFDVFFVIFHLHFHVISVIFHLHFHVIWAADPPKFLDPTHVPHHVSEFFSCPTNPNLHHQKQLLNKRCTH